MNMKVGHFGLTAYFADEVNWSLYLVDMTQLVAFDDQDCAHHMSGGSDVKEKDFPSSGAVKTGGVVRKSFSSWNALEASSFHSNLSDFLRSFKKGRPLPMSRLMNLLNAAMHPVSFIRSYLLLGGFMYLMALTLVGLASMPWLLTMKPGSFSDGTLNTHLVGLSFHLNFLRFSNVSERSIMNWSLCFVLTMTSST